jgi:acetyl-CoA carboxylase biotin carboxyl carrier protein
LDVERVEALVKLLHGTRVCELTVETEAWKISVTKGPAPARVPAVARRGPEEALPAEVPTDRVWITAHLVGIYRAGSPGVAVGDRVEPGQAVGSIEAMKILNPLVSEVGGEITALAVEDGQPVEYAQQLIEIRDEEEL